MFIPLKTDGLFSMFRPMMMGDGIAMIVVIYILLVKTKSGLSLININVYYTFQSSFTC